MKLKPGDEAANQCYTDLNTLAENIMYVDRQNYHKHFREPRDVAHEVAAEMIIKTLAGGFMRYNFPIVAYLRTAFTNRAQDTTIHEPMVSLGDYDLDEGFLEALVVQPQDPEYQDVEEVLGFLRAFYSTNDIKQYLPSALTFYTEDIHFTKDKNTDFRHFCTVFETIIRHVKGDNRLGQLYIGKRALDDDLKSLLAITTLRKQLTDQVDERLLGSLNLTSLFKLSRAFGGQTVEIPEYKQLKEIIIRTHAVSGYVFDDFSDWTAAKTRSLEDLQEQATFTQTESISVLLHDILTDSSIEELVGSLNEYLTASLDKTVDKIVEMSQSKDVDGMMALVRELTRLVTRMELVTRRIMREKYPLGG